MLRLATSVFVICALIGCASKAKEEAAEQSAYQQAKEQYEFERAETDRLAAYMADASKRHTASVISDSNEAATFDYLDRTNPDLARQLRSVTPMLKQTLNETTAAYREQHKRSEAALKRLRALEAK